MTDKAYILANEQQEHEVLEKLEREGLVWNSSEKPTEFIPIKQSAYGAAFPYALIDRGYVAWANLFQLKEDINIVYDGRKEEQMSDKYVVSQEFMNELNEWGRCVVDRHVVPHDLYNMPDSTALWQLDPNTSDEEKNNRLIAIIRWVNGEDVFEVEKPKKWVVRSKGTDEGGHYQYLIAGDFDMSFNEYHIEHATRFDTKEDAQSWANSHQEVIEVDE